ncbi:Hydramacin-1 [Bulinus truncatus]|nr:Hydramacin-1 [Bulinus truncatus]
MKLTLLVISVLLAGLFESSVQSEFVGNCFKRWSDCSGWSNWGKGNFREKCNDRCIDMGWYMGNCVPSPHNCPLDTAGFQCQCF